MPFDREVFYIEEGKLAEALELEQREFDKIVDSLETSSDENVRLKKWLHFVVQGNVNKQQPIRIFSREGAIAIASYLDVYGQTTELSLKRAIALLEQYRINQIDGRVRQTVYENSSSLVLRNQRHWLSREDVVRIFITTVSRLDRAFRDIQRSDFPMRINVDFENYGNTNFFSLAAQ